MVWKEFLTLNNLVFSSIRVEVNKENVCPIRYFLDSNTIPHSTSQNHVVAVRESVQILFQLLDIVRICMGEPFLLVISRFHAKAG